MTFLNSQGEKVDANGKLLSESKPEGASDLEALKAELDSLKKDLKAAEAKAVLPDDAKARLVAVSGISEALADKALAALTAKSA